MSVYSRITSKIKRVFGTLLNLRFNRGLEAAQHRANELHSKQFQTVVCVYCGRLLPKSEAGVVYNIENDTLEYSHEACFEKYEHGSAEMPTLREKGESHA